MLQDIEKASHRLAKYLSVTPLLYSNTLYDMLGNHFYFKMDALQKTGAFKIRGALNHLLYLKEMEQLPKKIVAYSTGNHALAAAFSAQLFNIEARIYLPENVSTLKKEMAKHYGAQIIEVKTRQLAEDLAKEDANSGYYYLHPSDHMQTIIGASTMAMEALIQAKDYMAQADYLIASCGGGGLLSGSLIARDAISPNTNVIGVEPAQANDAFKSLKQGKIFKFDNSPDTIADGLRALSLSERTFSFLQQLDDFILAEEDEIHYWTAWLFQLLKITCEPSSAICMAGAISKIKQHNLRNKNFIIMISGGNIDPSFYENVLSKKYCTKLPAII